MLRYPALLLAMACAAILSWPQAADAHHGHRYGGWGYGGCGGGYYGGYYGAYYGPGFYGPRSMAFYSSGPYFAGPSYGSYWSGTVYGPSYYAGPTYGATYSYSTAPMYSAAPAYSSAPLYGQALRTTTMYPPTDANGQVRAAATSPARPTTIVDVAMQDDQFQPASITVQPGSTVRWTNNGTHNHTVTAQDGKWDSGDILPGATYSATFQQPGTFAYYCRHHAGMQGTIVVASGSAPAAAAPGSSPFEARSPGAPPVRNY